ncbi:MAG TPA: PKD domain-containing protein [Bacteroidales bacterium]|nr:PKD domain-containing protein [Bacteroidales bacterium]
MKKTLCFLIVIIGFAHLANSQISHIISTGGTVNTCYGFFYDSGDALSNYSSNENFTMTFHSNDINNTVMQMNFTSFNVDPGDTLIIYDGTNISSPVIGKYNNNYAPPSFVKASIYNVSGDLTFQFISDSTVQTAGWEGAISCAQVCQQVIAVLDSALTIPHPDDSNTIKICSGTPVIFAAIGSGPETFPQNNTFYTQDYSTSLYVWNFGDGTTDTGLIVNHIYNDAHSYEVSLTITDVHGCTNSNQLDCRVYVSYNPFIGINPLPTVCSNTDSVVITAGYSDGSNIQFSNLNSSFYNNINGNIQVFDSTMFIPDGPSCAVQCYNTFVTFMAFTPGATITSAADILSICVNMEHSFSGDLGFRIICPNGQNVQLDPNTHSGGAYMGEPYGGSNHGSYDNGCNPVDNNPGTGWTYCWSEVYPQQGTLDNLSNSVSLIDSTNIYNNTNYITPSGPLSGLIGCPLNGTWNIEICDDYGIDNGYIFWWSINLDPSIVPAGWAYTIPIDTMIWSGPNIHQISDSSISVYVNSGGTFDYILSVTDESGCTYDTTITLTVITQPEINLGPDTTICNGSFISLDAGDFGSASYLWNTGDTSQAIYTPVAGLYSVTVTNTDGDSLFCVDSAHVQISVSGQSAPPLPSVSGAFRCNPGSVTLSASGGTSYIWYSALAGGNIVNYGPVFNTPYLENTTTYYVSNFNGCESMRVPVVAQINNIVVEAGTDTVIICGTNVILNSTTVYSGNNSLNYSWSPNTGLSSTTSQDPYAGPTQTTSYTVMVTDGLCTSFDEVTVFVDPINISMNFNANPQTLTSPPFNVQFDNLSPNMSNYNFTWYFGDGTSLQSNNLSVTHQYMQNGTYDVSLEASSINNGCTDVLLVNDLISCTGGINCTHTATINQTSPVSSCLGSTAALSCMQYPGAIYQWNYNDVPVPNSNSGFFFAENPGNYSVTVILDGCSITSGNIAVIFNDPPPIPEISAVGNFVYCAGGSITLSAPAGANSYLWSTNETTQSITVNSSGIYTVQVADIHGCFSQSEPYIVGASPLGTPDICIVGIDSVSGKNVVVWNKPISNAIDHFNIYSEGSQTNIFDLIGSVPYNAVSLYTDNSSLPGQQAYRYKITAVDTCNAETTLSAYHKTIHLTINQGMGNTYNLIWNYYEGFTFPSYIIYRGTSPTNMTLLNTLASSLNSYTDLTPPAGYVYYQVEAVNPTPCTPSKTTYFSSRSNIATNNTTAIENISIDDITVRIYPNPANDYLFVETAIVPSKTSIKIFNLEGQLIVRQYLTNALTSINISRLSKGIYFIKVENSEGLIVRKFVKE